VETTTLLFALAYLLMFLGVLGAFLPMLPGPLFIWLGALAWAWADSFQAVGWPTLAVMGVLLLLAWGGDLLLSTLGSRYAGAGWKAVAAAILGGLLGGILFSGLLPVIGTVLGTILGAVAGILAVEYHEKRDWGQAFQAGKGYVLGYLAASALKLALSLLMLAIFAWQAFA
jgi:uncharacterized protein YqgC (DUF456 family)